MRAAHRVAVALAGLVLASVSAFAGPVLQLKKGDLVPGRVTALDDEGVTFAPDSGGEMRVPWDHVVPLSRYELWESSLAADDAAGRVALAKWAHSADLFLYARRELLRAKGLGYAGPEDLPALVAQVDRDEAEAAIGDADDLVASGELEKALERVKTYLRTAPPGEQADRVRARAPDILARIERRDAAEREQEQERRKAEQEGRLKDWTQRNLAAAAKLEGDAAAAAVEGFEQLAKGNQTRTRDRLAAAETAYQQARDLLRSVRKAAGPGATADACDARIRQCDRRTVEVLIRWGRMETEQKAWKRASPIVDRGLRIDPVNRELLDLRAAIDEGWVRRRLSGITNAHPRESN